MRKVRLCLRASAGSLVAPISLQEWGAEKVKAKLVLVYLTLPGTGQD